MKHFKYSKKDNLGYEEIIFCSVIFLLLSLIKFIFFLMTGIKIV